MLFLVILQQYEGVLFTLYTRDTVLMLLCFISLGQRRHFHLFLFTIKDITIVSYYFMQEKDVDIGSQFFKRCFSVFFLLHTVFSTPASEQEYYYHLLLSFFTSNYCNCVRAIDVVFYCCWFLLLCCFVYVQCKFRVEKMLMLMLMLCPFTLGVEKVWMLMLIHITLEQKIMMMLCPVTSGWKRC